MILLATLVFFYLPFNSTALMGPHAYDAAVAAIRSFPLTAVAEIVFVWVPLAFYIMMGLVIVYRSSANVISYSYYRNWMYFLQRASFVIALVFIAFHVWTMRLAPSSGGGNATFAYVHAYASHLWVKIFYGVGIVAVMFHLVNGFASSLSTWGIVRGRRSQFAVSLASWVLVMILCLWGLRIFFQFAG